MFVVKHRLFRVMLLLGILALALTACSAPAASPEAGSEAAPAAAENDKIFRIRPGRKNSCTGYLESLHTRHLYSAGHEPEHDRAPLYAEL